MKKRQEGAALLVVIMLMPVLILISVKILTSAKSQTVITGNLQEKKYLQASASSVVRKVWTPKGLIESGAVVNSDVSKNGSVMFKGMKRRVVAKYKVSYKGENSLPFDMELNSDASYNSYKVGQHMFVVTGSVKSKDSESISVIEQGGYIVRPSQGG